MTFAPSSLDRLVTRTRLPWRWFYLLTSALLLLLPVAAASLDGRLDELLYGGLWRTLFLAPVIVIYSLSIYSFLAGSQQNAIEALRRPVQLEDVAFNRLVRKASVLNPWIERGAFAAGVLFGFLADAPWTGDGDTGWLSIYYPFATGLMLGLLAWIIYISLAGTRVQAVIHRQEMKIDIFDLKAFEPIGRYSLYVALAFVGGSALSVIFFNPFIGGINTPSLILYGTLALMTPLVFFVGMRPTHRVLAEKKEQEIEEVERAIAATFREMKARKARGEDVSAVSTELNLWLQYEARLRKARTWPYNTAMLRTLFLSILIPAGASLVQHVVGRLFSG